MTCVGDDWKEMPEALFECVISSRTQIPSHACSQFGKENREKAKASRNHGTLTSLGIIYQSSEEMQYSDGSMNNSGICPRKKLMRMITIHHAISLRETMKSRTI
jgi:hypothetical protein